MIIFLYAQCLLYTYQLVYIIKTANGLEPDFLSYRKPYSVKIKLEIYWAQTGEIMLYRLRYLFVEYYLQDIHYYKKFNNPSFRVLV